jgi:hypothetical protein
MVNVRLWIWIRRPLDRKESYDVIRTRLVKGINANEKTKVINEFYNYYVDKGISIEPDLKNDLKKSYPLHSLTLTTAGIDKRSGLLYEHLEIPGILSFTFLCSKTLLKHP